MTKGPDRRHRIVHCPTCNTELRVDGIKPSAGSVNTWTVCPECDTHVPITRAGAGSRS